MEEKSENTYEINTKLIEELKQCKKEIERLEMENKKLKEQLEYSHTMPVGQKPYNDKEVIKRIFDFYAAGESLKQIADTLNSEEVKTKRNRSWHKSTVKYILGNKKYVDLEYISKKKYKKVIELLQENRRRI